MNGMRVIITGCGSGFGYRMAQRFAAGGAQVCATMRDPNDANADAATALSALDNVLVVKLDVTQDGDAESAVAAAMSRFGGIDVLISNAGVWGPGVLEAFTVDQWQRLFEINVFGSVRAIRACLPQFRAQGRGLVVQMSSLQGRMILPFSGPYVASKWAVEAALEGFRYEVSSAGIECVLVQPYDYLTEMKDKILSWVATDDAVTDGYGPARSIIEAQYLSVDRQRSRDPVEVVDAVEALLAMPHGTRPVRTTVGNPLPAIDQMNDLQIDLQSGLFNQMGMASILTISTSKGGRQPAKH